MKIVNIYSKRNKEQPDIFKYDSLPKSFKVQVTHILIDSIGKYGKRDYFGEGILPSNKLWDFIHKTLCKEYGYFQLSEHGTTSIEKCVNFIDNGSVEEVLDILEVSFSVIDTIVRDMNSYEKQKSEITQAPDDAIFELNERFKEHGVGYQFIEGKVIRLDSDYLYTSAVEPAVTLLFEEGFEGASEEFLSAHEHFRKGRNKEAITDAAKAFESVMKTICKKMRLNVKETANANILINALFDNEIISKNLQSHFSALRTTLECGLPMVRNKNSAHGQGEKPIIVPPHLTAYALHLCATNIVFLIDSYKNLEK